MYGFSFLGTDHSIIWNPIMFLDLQDKKYMALKRVKTVNWLQAKLKVNSPAMCCSWNIAKSKTLSVSQNFLQHQTFSCTSATYLQQICQVSKGYIESSKWS